VAVHSSNACSMWSLLDPLTPRVAVITDEGAETWQATNMLPNLSSVVTALADRKLLRVEVLATWQLTNELRSSSNVVTVLADRCMARGG
jgi:hypothetical protein